MNLWVSNKDALNPNGSSIYSLISNVPADLTFSVKGDGLGVVVNTGN